MSRRITGVKSARNDDRHDDDVVIVPDVTHVEAGSLSSTPSDFEEVDLNLSTVRARHRRRLRITTTMTRRRTLKRKRMGAMSIERMMR